MADKTRTYRQTEHNVQFFVWHGSQNLCQAIKIRIGVIRELFSIVISLDSKAKKYKKHTMVLHNKHSVLLEKSYCDRCVICVFNPNEPLNGEVSCALKSIVSLLLSSPIPNPMLFSPMLPAPSVIYLHSPSSLKPYVGARRLFILHFDIDTPCCRSEEPAGLPNGMLVYPLLGTGARPGSARHRGPAWLC